MDVVDIRGVRQRQRRGSNSVYHIPSVVGTLKLILNRNYVINYPIIHITRSLQIHPSH